MPCVSAAVGRASDRPCLGSTVAPGAFFPVAVLGPTMGADADLSTTTLGERVTLLGIVSLSRRGETPTHAGQVVETCTWRFEEVEGDVLGKLSEAEVTRALNRLQSDGVVRESDDGDTSPVGKGRPKYDLEVDDGAVLEAFAGDDRLRAVVEFVRQEDRTRGASDT